MTSSSLSSLDLSHNNLEGFIPTSIFELGNLTSLDQSYNKLNGTKHRQMFQGSSELNTLRLSSNRLKLFPELENLSNLVILDLSNNQISGEIPTWIWEVGDGGLVRLNLSYNYLMGMQEPFFFPETLEALDLHFNQLQGNIPVFPKFLGYIDLSSNNFTSLPYDNFQNLTTRVTFCSLSNNSITGEVSENICAVKDILALDLSHNKLSGRIPTCLIETSNSLVMLNLAENNFKGAIPDVFPSGCTLKALDLHGNFIEGEIPKSLANCSELEVLHLGQNELIGEFPCLLMNLSTFHILSLQSNKLSGSIECPNANASWPLLQILDLAHNNLSGELPRRWLTKLQRMMGDGDEGHSEFLRLDFEYSHYIFYGSPPPGIHYVYTVTLCQGSGFGGRLLNQQWLKEPFSVVEVCLVIEELKTAGHFG
ncbi:hypothetical protein TIFTF001_028235 [Ficus carica]|uniref:Uncharacterized protein n=1 Tax=Ficus carica TaxID=3494 RepID=A0AA88DPG1_FICCA|nr:hypothetical protein TIFTF001_028235 [Ficus carica]